MYKEDDFKMLGSRKTVSAAKSRKPLSEYIEKRPKRKVQSFGRFSVCGRIFHILMLYFSKTNLEVSYEKQKKPYKEM